MSDPSSPASEFDTSVAHPARRYNYWPDGKDNFAAGGDRREQQAVIAATREPGGPHRRDEPGSPEEGSAEIGDHLSEPTVLRVEIDGRTPSVERLRAVALAGYGHFTAMQVRNRRVRGLDLHLKRLDEANREVFGTDLDGDLIRDHIRHALSFGTPDASVRVLVHCPDADQAPSVTVVVRSAAAMAGPAWRLQSVPYQRSVAHIKHIGDFGQSYYGRLAQRNGFDEALLTAPDGTLSEGAMTNIGFFDGTTIVWPAAPLLHGITMRLLQAKLPTPGLESRHGPVRLTDVGSFAGAFVANARGIAPVRQIDAHELPVDTGLMTQLAEIYESVPWDQI